MLSAPVNNWSFFKSQKRKSDIAWLRGLTERERFDIYSSLFDAIWITRRDLPGDWDEIEKRRWQRKLILRDRMVEAFKKLDVLRRESPSSHDAC